MFINVIFIIIIFISITNTENFTSNEDLTINDFNMFDQENSSDEEFVENLQEQQVINNYQDILKTRQRIPDEFVMPESLADTEMLQQNEVLTTKMPNIIQMLSSQPDNYSNNVIAGMKMSKEKSTNQGINFSDDENRIMLNSTAEEEIDQYQTTLRTKHGKQIQILQLPHEILRNYIEDIYIRKPLATLIDTSSTSLEKTKILWKNTLRSNAALDVILLAFNGSGVSITYSFKNTRTLLAGINSIKESENSSGKGNSFLGIIRACELIPFDSAIFISTGLIPADTNLAQYAAVTLLRKRIRLYLIWFGDKNISENEANEVITGGVLGEVVIRSGGEILCVDINPIDMDETSMDIENLVGTLNSSNINIDSTMRTATSDSSIGGGGNGLSKRSLKSLNTGHDSVSSEEIKFPNNRNEKSKNLQNVESAFNINDNINNFDRQTIMYEKTNINLGIQSQLLVKPGMSTQLYFEITNLGNVPVFHNIQVVDEKKFLRSLNPQSIWLGARQTGIVFVTVLVPSVTEIGTRDKITLISQGFETVSHSAELKVISDEDVKDTTAPTLTWTFESRCDNIGTRDSCSENFWTLRVSAQDWETGLLRIQSVPKGLLVRNDFIAGTTISVKGFYTANCCQPRVTISAYDLAGNQKTISIDVRDIILTEATIAAIVLGVLLLILLIVLLIVVVVCYRKRKTSRDLPSYRSRSERTT